MAKKYLVWILFFILLILLFYLYKEVLQDTRSGYENKVYQYYNQ